MQHDYAKQYARLYRQHWWWRSRETAVTQTIRRLTYLKPNATILDVGCGDALSLPMLSTLAPNAQAWGIEIDDNTILPDNPLRNRIYDKPLGDDIYQGLQFNLITSLDVIEHIQDDRAAVGHMMKMLRPGGWLVLTVPAMPVLWTQHDEMNMHYRRYTRASLTNLLKQHGELLDCRYMYASLAMPKLILAGLQRKGESKPSTPQVPPRMINRVLQWVCQAEWAVTKRLRVPFGSSLIAVVRKPDEVAASSPKPNTTDLAQAA